MDYMRLGIPGIRGQTYRVRHPRERPAIVANPATDQRFRDLVDLTLMPGELGPGDLETVLRVRYPHAKVRRRDLEDEDVEVWYVYRDGHWLGSESDAER